MITAVVGGVCFFLGSVTIAPLWIRSGRRAERKDRARADQCPHAWDRWEECQIGDGWYWEGTGKNERRVQRLVAGQKRDCTICGEREVRKVVTPV